MGPNEIIYFSLKSNPQRTQYAAPDDMVTGFHGSCYNLAESEGSDSEKSKDCSETWNVAPAPAPRVGGNGQPSGGGESGGPSGGGAGGSGGGGDGRSGGSGPAQVTSISLRSACAYEKRLPVIFIVRIPSTLSCYTI